MPCSMWPAVLLLGDSQTQQGWAAGGWVAGLADALTRRADVLNRGLSGYNSRMVRAVLPDLCSAEQWRAAKVVVILLGSNDASLPETNPEQAVPVEEFGENLLHILSFLLGVGVPREAVVLVTPPPVLPEQWAAACSARPGPPAANCKSEALTRAVAGEVAAVAARLGVTLVDLHQELTKPGVHLPAVLSDGLHLGPQGSAALLALLAPVILGKLGAAAPPLMPEWRQLDNADVAAAYTRWKAQ